MINILLITETPTTGIGYYRQLMPHFHLSRNYEGYTAIKATEFDFEHIEKIKDYQIIVFSRIISIDKDKAEKIVEWLRSKGIVVIFDIDDYWQLPKTHRLYRDFSKFEVPQRTVQSIELADHVITTQYYLADKIKQINKNVTIIPNAIDPEQPQYESYKIESERLRFGWIGSRDHLYDILLLREDMEKLIKNFFVSGKYQIVLGGFSEGFITFEKILTNDWKIIKGDSDYINYLKQFQPTLLHYMERKPYKRIWGMQPDQYVSMYNQIDVALAPLCDNEFERCKSQLKIIEAGFMKKAVICSNVIPYQIDCVHNKNSLVARYKGDWYRSMVQLMNNKNLVEDLSENLYETVKERYHIKTANDIRNDLYQQLIHKKNAN